MNQVLRIHKAVKLQQPSGRMHLKGGKPILSISITNGKWPRHVKEI